MEQNRILAIRILESLAEMLDDENIFDLDWFNFEEKIKNILDKGDKLC